MKRIFSLILALLIIFSFAACGDKAEKKEEAPDNSASDSSPSGIAAELLDSGAFSENLMEIDRDIGEAYYGIDAALCEEACFYMSSGATSEEIAVFSAVDKAAAESIVAAIDKRLDFQIHSFENYVPTEVPKLEAADLRQDGLLIALCVSNDNDCAGKVLDKYF